jgi:hypothetical protein
MGVRTFQVDVPAPYRLDLTVWTLRRRAHNEIDRWDGSSYQRTLMVAGRSIEATVCQQPTPRRRFGLTPSAGYEAVAQLAQAGAGGASSTYLFG